MVSADWWSLFLELEAAAVFTFVVLDSLTGEIRRELDHLMAKGRPFIVVCSVLADVKLVAEDAYRYRVITRHPAAKHVVFTKDHLSQLQSALSDVVISC